MAYLPELHYCVVCGDYLGPDDGDGICADDDETVECPKCLGIGKDVNMADCSECKGSGWVKEAETLASPTDGGAGEG